MTPHCSSTCRCLVAAVSLLAACSERESAPLVTRSDSAGVTLVRISAAPAVVPEWSLRTEPEWVLTGGETGDSTAFARVELAAWVADGGVVVVDQAGPRLFLYDSLGTFRRQLGRAGDGPGDLRYVSSVAAGRGDTLMTFDGRLARLSLWHAHAGFLRSVAMAEHLTDEGWLADAWRWSDSLVVALHLSITPKESLPPAAGVRRWPMRAQLVLRDGAGRTRGESPAFDGMYTALHEDGDSQVPFSNRPFAAPAGERIYFGDGQDFRLKYLDRSFRVAGEIVWPAMDEALGSAEIDSMRADLIERSARRIPRVDAEARAARAFAPAILPPKRPSVGRVFGDDAGRVWVERFEPVRLGTLEQLSSASWTVLSSEGEPVGRLRLPSNARLVDVRQGRALLIRRDSVDLVQVTVHRLEAVPD